MNLRPIRRFHLAAVAVVALMCFPDRADASDLFLPDGSLNPLYATRCPPGLELGPDECAIERNIAAQAGCIDEWERKHAEKLGVSVSCRRSNPARIMTACPCSCFRRGTRILVGRDEQSSPKWRAVEALEGGDQLLALEPDARLPHLRFVRRGTSYVTSGPEEERLYVLNLENGKEIAVTQHHALLLDTGKMTSAKRVTTADRLVGEDGKAVAIRAITRQVADADVVNFLVDTDDIASHLVVAEGVVAGDLRWQNILEADMQAVSLR